MPSRHNEALRPRHDAFLLSNIRSAITAIACIVFLSCHISQVSSSNAARSYSIVLNPEHPPVIALHDIETDGRTRELRPGKLILQDNGAFLDVDHATNNGSDPPVPLATPGVCDVFDPSVRPEDYVGALPRRICVYM
jgi:hypothetical protein